MPTTRTTEDKWQLSLIRKQNSAPELLCIHCGVRSVVGRCPLSLAANLASCESYLFYSGSVRALRCDRVGAVSHRRVTNKHYDAFASAVSINQTAPVAVPHGHYGSQYELRAPYVMPFRLRSPSVLTTLADCQSLRVLSKLFAARRRPLGRMSGRRGVWTRCRQIGRGLAARVALWFNAVTSTSRFIRRCMKRRREDDWRRPPRRAHDAGREIFQKLLMQH